MATKHILTRCLTLIIFNLRIDHVCSYNFNKTKTVLNVHA